MTPGPRPLPSEPLTLAVGPNTRLAMPNVRRCLSMLVLSETVAPDAPGIARTGRLDVLAVRPPRASWRVLRDDQKRVDKRNSLDQVRQHGVQLRAGLGPGRFKFFGSPGRLFGLGP